jgi:DNA-directed RNA polymerase subunit M/transcription elongation factor TFIIS
MEFCEKCGSLMIVEKKRKHTFLVCKRCGWKKKSTGKISITNSSSRKERSSRYERG